MQHQGLRTIYKAILKLHRSLPQDLKALGDGYVKDEFRRHLKGATDTQVKIFATEWTDYYTTLAKQLGVSDRLPNAQVKVGGIKGNLGRSLSPDKLDDFEDTQLYQLYELKLASGTSSEDRQSTEGVTKGSKT